MIYVYKNTKSTFSGWTIPESCVQVSDEDYAKLVNDELMWENDQLVANPDYATIKAERDAQTIKNNKLKQIAELKQQLADSDYKAIKYAEGLISEEDYASIKAERQALRDRINSLSL